MQCITLLKQKYIVIDSEQPFSNKVERIAQSIRKMKRLRKFQFYLRIPLSNDKSYFQLKYALNSLQLDGILIVVDPACRAKQQPNNWTEGWIHEGNPKKVVKYEEWWGWWD